MLHVPETHVQKARYPVIDVHSHLTWTTRAAKGVSTGEDVTFNTTPKEALAVMDRKGIRAMVNLTGGTGKGLAPAGGCIFVRTPGTFVIPSLNIEKILPATGTETLDIPASQPGQIAYTCGMGMYTGVITVV